MDIINSLIDWVTQQFTSVLELFPLSPFTDAIATLASLPYINYVNWFIPIDNFLTILSVWISMIALYYLYSVVARWVKVIE